MNPIDMIKRSDIEPYELRRIAFGAILTALPSAIFQLQSAASVILLIAAGIACKVRSRALDLGIAAVLFALTVRSAIRLDPYSIGYLATAFTCFAVSGLKEE